MSELTTTVPSADESNYNVEFLPADPNEPDSLPCMVLLGMQVYTYIGKDGRRRVSIDVETAEPELLTDDDCVVPCITVGDGPDLWAVMAAVLETLTDPDREDGTAKILRRRLRDLGLDVTPPRPRATAWRQRIRRRLRGLGFNTTRKTP